MKGSLSRRKFLQTGAVAGGGLMAANTILLEASPVDASTKSVAPSDRVRFGIIGVGMEGSYLLAEAIALPGVECIAAADLYDGRHTLAKELTNNPSLATTRRYQELLDNKEVDCIIAAVPDHWHRKVMIDAISAGKDVYCEKPMSHSAEDGVAVVEAAQRNGRIVQIGSQRVSSELCRKARELVHNGAIGDLSLVELSMGRNDPTGAWQYPPPTDLSPATLDWDTWLGSAPKIPFNAMHFARWRCWKEYGTGVAGDLMVHLISGMMYALGWNEPPKRAQAFGGIYRFADGRNMPDVHTVIFEYNNLPVYCRLTLGTETEEVARFMGSKGILELGEFELRHSPQSGMDKAPSYYTSSFPQRMREEYVKQWHRKHDPQIGQEPIFESSVDKGHDYDDVRPHLWTFFQAVKSRQPVVEDAVFGHHAALACHMANESYFRKSPVTWDAGSKRII
jgi:predicted dehydrogenase